MLQISDLTYRVQGSPLLEGATVTINRGERVGLVGRNGSGKTTLLRLICGDLHVDGGSISVPNGIRIGRVAQEAPSGAESLLETVLAADRERIALLAEAETAGDPQRIAEIHERLATLRAASAPARAARILAGLGFDEAAQQQTCAALSGGWRMRVALAALLFSEPELLLLDEPTNHLDLEASLWLEGYLSSYPGTFLLVSHDRMLLNRAVNNIVHLESRRLTRYSGGYDRFERTWRKRLELEGKMRAKQIAERRHIQAFVDRFRYKASKARQAQSRLKALARMEPIADLIAERTVNLSFPQPEPLSPPIINLEGASAGYGAAPPVLQGLNLRIDMDDRIALLGANGNGKSTLARLLSLRLKPQQGRVTRSPKLKIGYFAQDQAEELDLAATPLDHVRRLMPMTTDTRLRAQLGRFGFGVERADIAVGKLSGGEKARLLFALMSREAPHLLILDEPTNHLDVDARQSLIQALNAYEGAVILISHDPHLVELVADRLWLVANGRVETFEGDLEDYRKLLLEQRRREREKNRPQAKTPQTKRGRLSRKEQRRQAAEARTETAAIRKAARKAEKQHTALLQKKAELEAKLADPESYDGNGGALEALQIDYGRVAGEIAAAEEAWLEAQAALEAIEETAS